MMDRFIFTENPEPHLSVLAEKPALDPTAAKLWTLSANDMDDDDVVSVETRILIECS